MALNPSISVVRMFAMCSIVACHVLQRFSNPLAFWFNGGVQIFLVVSGYLYGSRRVENPLGFILRNWCKVLVPCWVFLLCAFVGFYCFGFELPKGVKLARVLLLADTVPGLGHLWFISNILFCYMMVPLFYCLKQSLMRMNEWCFILSVSLIVLVIVAIGFAYCPFVKPSSLVCFVVGYYLAAFHEIFKDDSRGRARCEVGLVLIGVCALLCRIMYEMSPWHGSFGRLYLSCFPYVKAAIGIAIFLVLKRYVSCPYNFVLKFSDRYSYTIYLTHHIFILGPLSIIGSFWTTNIIAVMAVIISAVLLKELTNPIIATLTSKLK